MSYYPNRRYNPPARPTPYRSYRYQRPVRRMYPQRKYIRGRGAYNVDNDPYSLKNGPWAKHGAALGGAIGSHYGGIWGRAAGAWAGRRLFHYPAKFFGSGAYTMKDAGTTRLAPQVPTFTKDSSDDSVCITHREYLGDIITSGTAGGFSINKYGLNPSDLNTFPWLSNIAQPNYQQYKFEGLVFEFKSFSADALNSTNTALGSVFACINYDYTDQDLASRYEVENTDWSSSCKPSEHMMIPVECKPKQTGMNGLLYVVNGSTLPPNTDPKTYYLGKLWVGTTGFQGTSVNIGSLYVTYKIRLYKPLMTPPLSNALITLTSRLNATVAAPFGVSTDTTSLNIDSWGVSVNGTGTVLTINKSRLVIGQVFMLMFSYVGAATANVSRPNFSLSSNLQNYNISNGGTNNLEAFPTPNVNTGSTVLGYIFFLRVTDSNQDATLTGTATGLLPTGAHVDIKLMQICGALTQNIGIYTP